MGDNLHSNEAPEKRAFSKYFSWKYETKSKAPPHPPQGAVGGSETPPHTSSASKKEQEKKGEQSSSKVVIENQTDKVLVLRDKFGAAYGQARHQIGPGKSIAIEKRPQHSFYRMLVYAVKVNDTKTEDTGLTIDSDILSDARCIVISTDKDDKYIFSQSKV